MSFCSSIIILVQNSSSLSVLNTRATRVGLMIISTNYNKAYCYYVSIRHYKARRNSAISWPCQYPDYKHLVLIENVLCDTFMARNSLPCWAIDIGEPSFSWTTPISHPLVGSITKNKCGSINNPIAVETLRTEFCRSNSSFLQIEIQNKLLQNM